MDDPTLQIASQLLPEMGISAGLDVLRAHSKQFKTLFSQRRLPDDGCSLQSIQLLLAHLAAMDTNNSPHHTGLGEREGRVVSKLVQQKHLGFTHGIGRSGALSAAQPKALGSSLALQLTNALVKDILRRRGMKLHCAVVPAATGMSIFLCLSALKQQRPNAKYLLMPRMDQRSAPKAALLAGIELIAIDPIDTGHGLQTNVEAIHNQLQTMAENGTLSELLCVLPTTSTFAPRLPDEVEPLSSLCASYDIPFLINNAYGIQDKQICTQIGNCSRMDYVVMSTDKNFLVPIGGSIIASPSKAALQQALSMYAGRAPMSPILDLLVTLLELGNSGLQDLWRERETCYQSLLIGLNEIASEVGLSVMETPDNRISIALSLAPFGDLASEVGGMLFRRGVTGARVCTLGKTEFGLTHWGTHSASTSTPYLACAAAVGVQMKEIERFLDVLRTVLLNLRSRLGDSFNPEVEFEEISFDDFQAALASLPLPKSS